VSDKSSIEREAEVQQVEEKQYGNQLPSIKFLLR
jgi:hypothetical protein